jgi:hypothetical protein
MLWMERRGGGGSDSTSSSNEGEGSTAVGIDDGDSREDDDGLRLSTAGMQMFQIGQAAQTDGFELRLRFFRQMYGPPPPATPTRGYRG